MYREAVGRLGMDPTYFLERCGLQEAADFVEGARMREREPWERLRLLANVVAHCVTGNDLNMTLPWEMPTKEEQAASLEEAIAAAKMMEAMVAAGDLKGLKG